MSHLRLWRLLLPALLIASLIVMAPPARAQDSRLAWSRIGGVDRGVTLESVFMINSAHAWAVGHNSEETAGYAYRLTWQDGRWQVAQADVLAQALYAVAALSADVVWAVGSNGYIVKYGDAGWQQYDSPVPDASLRAIQMLGDGSQGWAMGYTYDPVQSQSRPVALRYSGERWAQASIEAAPSGGTVYSVHINEDAGWAVGNGIWRLRDGAWKLEQSPRPCGDFGCVGGFSSVRTIDSQRAIAVGSWVGICAICTSHFYVAERDSGGWRSLVDDDGLNSALPAAPAYPDTTSLAAIYLTDARNGLAVGNRYYPHADGRYGPDSASIFGLRYSDGSWSYEPILSAAPGGATALFMNDSSHALLVGSGGLVLSYGYGPQDSPVGNPTAPAADPGRPEVLYFPATGHSLGGAFRSYWERYGGLAQFGYPLTEEYREVNDADGRAYVVQYFERARFEHHPENAGTPYEVLLGLLGQTVTTGRRDGAAFQAAAPGGQPGSRYVPETQHTMAAEFVGYWDSHGGLAIYGYPISEPFYELNAADGKSYLVQYFERNRFEHHPENAGTPYEVLLGLLGRETLRARGWLQ